MPPSLPEVNALFECGSGSELNRRACGLVLWSGRAVPPIAFDWLSVRIKVLGVFIGSHNLDEDNWQPCITAVENILASWKGRSLSCRGRALVINALALSRVWYVASLVHMPPWVLSELCKLVFDFFWKGKRDLVSRSVVVQPTFTGGFNVFDVQFKVWSLVVQWVKRFSVSPSSCWAFFMSCWFRSVFDASPLDVLSSPNPWVLPPFYCSLLLAWHAVDGSFSLSHSALVMGSSSSHHLCLASGMSTKFCYVYLLSENQSTPPCVEKFFFPYGPLYWSSTWCQLFLFDLDRPVIDLMHLSMLSPRVGGGGGYPREIDSESFSLGRDFDIAAILEDQENLLMSHPPSW